MPDSLKRLPLVPCRPESAMPVRSWLRRIVLACVLPLVAAAVIAVFLVYQRARDATYEHAAATARVLLRGVDAELDAALSARRTAGSSAMERATMFGAGLAPEALARGLQGMPTQAGWMFAVLDGQGMVVSRSAGPGPRVGQPASQDLLAALAGGLRTGVTDSAPPDAMPMLAAFERSPLTGWTVVVGKSRDELLAPVHALAWWMAGAVGAAIALSVLAAHLLARGLAQTIDDERRRAVENWQSMRLHAEQMAHAAHHDALTGLCNRRHFVAQLATQLEHAQATGGRVAVLFIDLNDFKPVNDLHGHGTGDKLLRAFAARLRAGVRNQDLVARLGGDEFAVLMEGLPRSMVRIIVDALSDRLSRPYRVSGMMLEASAGIGVAHFPEDGQSAASLLAAADAAMYEAKGAAKRVRGQAMQRAATAAGPLAPSQAPRPDAAASLSQGADIGTPTNGR